MESGLSLSPAMIMLLDWLVVKGGLIALVLYDLYRTNQAIKRRRLEKESAAKRQAAEILSLPLEKPAKLKEAA